MNPRKQTKQKNYGRNTTIGTPWGVRYNGRLPAPVLPKTFPNSTRTVRLIRQICYIVRTLLKILIAERSKLWSCSACPIGIFCQYHLQLATWQVVMLEAELT